MEKPSTKPRTLAEGVAKESMLDAFLETLGRGRPGTGVAIHTRVPADLLAEIDDNAVSHGESRATAVRRLLNKALGHDASK